MKFITYYKLNKDLLYNLNRIPRDIDIVVGIPRSGLILANMIALYLNKPLADIDSFLNREIYAVGNTKNTKDIVLNFEQMKKALIVDDSVSSGNSLIKVKNNIENHKFEIEFIYLTGYIRSETKELVDIYFNIIDEDRVFEWNYMHNLFLNQACIDIDGVLCVDPTNDQNDDGENYLNFIRNARPKLIPSRKVGYIVTARLEKYRYETQKWLESYSIQYKQLIMMNIDSAEERRELNNHGIFKATIYKNLKDATWFIESDKSQAEEIAKISGKMVFCVSNQSCYSENTKIRLKTEISQNFFRKGKAYIKKVIPQKVVYLYKKMKYKK